MSASPSEADIEAAFPLRPLWATFGLMQRSKRVAYAVAPRLTALIMSTHANQYLFTVPQNEYGAGHVAQSLAVFDRVGFSS